MALFETIQYQLIKKTGHIEIRKYDSFLLASTKTLINTTLDTGFNNVFSYISGNNDQNQKISMTKPVVTYEEKQELVTGFYVPSKYSKSTVPNPVSQSVFINEMNEAYYAVIRFSGNWRPKNIEKHDQKLLQYLAQNKIIIISRRYLMRYQPPFIPGFLRRNEIAYQIKSFDKEE